MYNTMIRNFCVIISAVLLLCGCGTSDSANIHITESSYETDLADVKVESFEISHIADKEFAAQINSEISNDINGALVSFDTMVADSREDLRMGNKCVLNITQEVKNNSNNLLSIVEEHYIYTGGAHGSYMLYPRNYNLNSSKQIYLSDLFCDNGYTDVLNTKINELVASNPETYGELWEKPQIMPQHEYDFYFENNRLVIFFQPYTLSYFAKGYITFPIKLSEISGYLHEEYRPQSS